MNSLNYQSTEKSRNIMKTNYQVSVYHNYNDQKLQIKSDNSNGMPIQPLSKLLNLNLQKQVSDKSPIAANRNSYNPIQQIFSTGNENTNLRIDQQNQSSLKQQVQFFKKNYQNGIYFGQMNIQHPHGEGGFFWDNGCFYYGQWRDGLMHGCGLFIFKTGSVLRGNFKKGRAHGLAELSFFSTFQQQILNGFWIEGQFEGQSPAQFYQNGFTQSFEKKELDSSQEKQLFVGIFPLQKQQENERDSFQRQFEVNPYYYDTELKKRLMNYYACENSIEVGERRNNLLNGLAIRFYFDGKIEFGSFKKGLLEGRGKIIFRTGDIYDGYFINSAFQGPGVYYNNQDKIWAYGAFSKSKIMYLQQQNSTYPPPALYDLRQKDEYVDSSDRLIGENQLRDRNKIIDQVLIDNMQRKANGDYVYTEPHQTIKTDQTEEDFSTSIQKGVGSPLQIGNEPHISNIVPSNNNSNNEFINNQASLRKTADFGNTIKNLSTIFQTIPNNNQEESQIKENKSVTPNNFFYEDERKSLQEKIIEKQLEMDDNLSHPTFHLSQPSQQLPTHQTVTGLTPRSQNFLSARHLTSINADGTQINFTSDNLDYPNEFGQKYYGISQETYQIIKELEKDEILQKKRDKSTEKISQIKALITDYLSKPTAVIAQTPNNKTHFDQNLQSKNLNGTSSKVNNENLNPLNRRTPSSIASSSTRNLFSGFISNQNSKSKRDSFNKQQQAAINVNYSNKKNSNYNSSINLINNANNLSKNIIHNQIQSNKSNQNINNNNFQANQNSNSKSPLRQQESNLQSKVNINEKQQQAQQLSQSKSNQQMRQNQNQFSKVQQRIKNYSHQFEPQNLMKVFSPDQKQKTNQSNQQNQHIQSENTPISSNLNYPNFSQAQNVVSSKNNPQHEINKQFYFTQSCRNHKRHVSSINFSSSNISNNQGKQKGGSSQIQPKRSQYPLSIQIY